MDSRPPFLGSERRFSVRLQPSDVAKHVGRNARALPSLTTSLLRQLAHHHHNAHSTFIGNLLACTACCFFVLESLSGNFFAPTEAHETKKLRSCDAIQSQQLSSRLSLADRGSPPLGRLPVLFVTDRQEHGSG